MRQVSVIEKNNQRVLTTAQIAEVFGTDYKTISKNFTRNKGRYEEGRHYFVLQNDNLKQFKTDHQIDDQSKHSHTLYLWTSKGAFLHAKSLNTDLAWDTYNNLVDDYFNKVEELKQEQADMSALSPQLQFMIISEQRQNALEDKQKELEKENSDLKQSFNHLSLVVDNEVWITEHQKADIKVAVKNRIGHLKGKMIDAHFQGLYGDLNTYFSVSKYDKIKRSDYEDAMEYVKSWFPKKKENSSS